MKCVTDPRCVTLRDPGCYNNQQSASGKKIAERLGGPRPTPPVEVGPDKSLEAVRFMFAVPAGYRPAKVPTGRWVAIHMTHTTATGYVWNGSVWVKVSTETTRIPAGFISYARGDGTKTEYYRGIHNGELGYNHATSRAEKKVKRLLAELFAGELSAAPEVDWRPSETLPEDFYAM
jgi:hypothetical protein